LGKLAEVAEIETEAVKIIHGIEGDVDIGNAIR
jgi:hypothetical protein